MLTELEVSSLACKCVFYRPEHNAKGRNTEMQKWNIPADRAQSVDEKNGDICLFIMFVPRFTVIKMLKMAHFLYFLLMTPKNQSQFGTNTYVHLKDLS